MRTDVGERSEVRGNSFHKRSFGNYIFIVCVARSLSRTWSGSASEGLPVRRWTAQQQQRHFVQTHNERDFRQHLRLLSVQQSQWVALHTALYTDYRLHIVDDDKKTLHHISRYAMEWQDDFDDDGNKWDDVDNDRYYDNDDDDYIDVESNSSNLQSLIKS